MKEYQMTIVVEGEKFLPIVKNVLADAVGDMEVDWHASDYSALISAISALLARRHPVLLVLNSEFNDPAKGEYLRSLVHQGLYDVADREFWEVAIADPIFQSKSIITMPRGIYMPDEKQLQCDKCKTSISEAEFFKSLKVCPHCNYHNQRGYYITAFERLNLLVDDGTFVEYDANLYSLNPLNFPEYEEKLAIDIQKTGLKSEMLTGEALIGGYRTAIGIGEPNIRMGSTGAVIGEKITRLIERAIEKRLPLIIVSPFGGGMRMQEGTISLMQMAKTAAACARYIEAGLFYISVLTHVTMGGNAASFASLGHVIIAEPGTVYGFAGDRTRSSIGMEMPPEVQTAEYQLEYGMIDMIVQRKDMRATLIDLLDFYYD